MEVLHNLFFNILFWTSMFDFIHTINSINPDLNLSVEEIIKKHNYPFEKHSIQTEDGYFLEIHRIPNNKFKNKMKSVPPILIYSGFLADSSTWVLLGPKRGLGFILADQGYDVWMGNNRGTISSKKHLYLDPYKDKKEFWNFSFQEMGYYDIPVTIDYILNVTKQEQLMYLGYSQGAASYFAMLSEKPDYNNKIKFAIVLAPMTSVQNSLSISIRLLMQNVRHLQNLMETHNIYDLMPLSKERTEMVAEYCSPTSQYLNLCAEMLCTIFGASIDQTNKSTIDVVLSNFPAGASAKQAIHLLQLNKGTFQKYDYGGKYNLNYYGQENPPIFNLSKVNTPTAIIYASHDVITSQKDVELLVPKLPNIVGMKLIPKFNHIDLSLGVDAPALVFPDILKYLQKYS